MFRLASSLASKVRLPDSTIRLVPARFCWRRNFFSQNIKFCGPLIAHPANQLIQRPKLAENHTCDLDEDGLRYLSIMRQAMFIEGRKVLGSGVDAMDLKSGIYMALDAINKHLKCRARMVNTFEEISQVGTAAGGVRKIGELIAEAMEGVGKGGFCIVSEKKNCNIELELMHAMKLNWGNILHIYPDEKFRTIVFKNPNVLIHENKISNKNVVKHILGPNAYKRPLLIITEGVEMEVAGSLVLSPACCQSEICVVKPLEFEENWKGIIQDLAIFTGGRVVTGESDFIFLPTMLGSCKEAVVSGSEMMIRGSSGGHARIRSRCEQLRSAIKLSTSDYERKLLEERLMKLSAKVATLKVGGATRTEVHKRSKRVHIALNAVKAAVEEGILPGGGVALLHASKELDKLQMSSSGEKIGVQLLQHVLKMPVYTIASAAGFEGSVVVRKLLEHDNPDIGFDPVRGEYVDAVECGLVDPLKLIKKILDDVTSYFLTELLVPLQDSPVT
ncbi:hypothetical protein AB3S75_000016 [Citrus x aurantiifolia]